MKCELPGLRKYLPYILRIEREMNLENTRSEISYRDFVSDSIIYFARSGRNLIQHLIDIDFIDDILCFRCSHPNKKVDSRTNNIFIQKAAPFQQTI